MEAATSGQPSERADILIVANFVSTTGSGNCRFNDLAQRLTALGADVELVTSDFEHQTHSARSTSPSQQGYQVTLVHEPGYPKNISVKRLISQHLFGKNVKKYLKSRSKVPDLVFCAAPPPSAAKACAQYAHRTGSAYVVDIQDLWPEAFTMRFRTPKLIRVLFNRMIEASRTAYSRANIVLGVSQTYVDHAKRITKSPLDTRVVFLGTSLASDDLEVSLAESTPPTRGIRLAYAGTLSHSYDLPMVMDAMSSLARSDQRFKDVELVVLGDGPMRQNFEDYGRRSGVSVAFRGRLPYAEMLRELRQADIAVNPIVAGSAGSVLNKVGDYAAAGLPVINTQESPEYRQLLERYDAGVNCDTGSTAQVASAIRQLVDYPTRRTEMGRNNRRMAEELFDRDKTYNALAHELIDLAQGNNVKNLSVRPR